MIIIKRTTPEELPSGNYWAVGHGEFSHTSKTKPKIFFRLLRRRRRDIIVVFHEYIVVSTCVQVRRSRGKLEMIMRPKPKSKGVQCYYHPHCRELLVWTKSLRYVFTVKKEWVLAEVDGKLL